MVAPSRSPIPPPAIQPPDDPAQVEAAARALERLPELVNGDARLVHRGRFLTTDCLIQVGPVPFHLSIAAGRIAALERGPRLMHAVSFSVRASARAWLKFWQPVPEPKWHDVFALTRYGEATVEGYLFPLMANLQYMKDVLAAPRRVGAGPAAGRTLA